MIKIIKGTYGHVVNGVVYAKNKNSEPFALPEEREAELIAEGVAVKVEEPAQESPYADMKMAELRKAAAAQGVDVSAAKTKKEVIALLEAEEKAPEPKAETEEGETGEL